MRPPQQAVRFQPIHQFDGAVMLDLQPLREHADGGVFRAGQTFNGEQRLKLLRLDAGSVRRLVAQDLEAPDFVTKIGQRLIVVIFVVSRSQGQ
jgi:hypothetical protein